LLPSAVHAGRLSSCSTGRSSASKKTSFTHVICPKNKPFFAETLKAGKAVAAPPNMDIGEADVTMMIILLA
jgi:hypothetical protein